MQIYTLFCEPETCLKSNNKIISKSVRESTQRCLSPLRISKKSPKIFIVLYNNLRVVMELLNKLFNFVGHPILIRILNKLSLLTRSNAFVRLMKEIYNGIFCSLHFPAPCGLKKLSQLLIYLNEIYSGFPGIHAF